MAKYKFVGEGANIPGVPARDLTQKEFDAIPEKFRELAGILYTAEKPKSDKAVSDDASS